MDLQLTGKTALVTGASRGIGHAIALGLAREGVHVAVAARRRNLLDELADEIKRAGGKLPAVVEADLYNPETPERLAATAQQQLGRVDILINAAGGSRPIPFEAPLSVWEEGMTLNFFRLRELTHALIPGCGATASAASSTSPEPRNRAGSMSRTPPRRRSTPGPRACRASWPKTASPSTRSSPVAS